ncbi:MAG: DMT family transporter [Candidatus Thorarchaeota archaeon]
MQLAPDTVLGLTVGITMAFFWGVATVVYKSQGKEASAIAIGSIKMWLALLVMAILVFNPFRSTPFFIPIDSIFFLVASITLAAVIGDVIFIAGQERIGVAYAFPIVNVYPITTYLFAVLLVGEELVPIRLVGVILAVLGVSIVARQHSSENPDENKTEKQNYDFIGLLMVIAAIFFYSLGTISLQIGVTNVDPIDANLVRVFFGSIFFVPMYLGAKSKGMAVPSGRATKIILAGGFFGMALGSLMYTTTVKLIGASVSSVLGALSPLFGIPVSVAVLGEKISKWAGVGVLLSIFGIILVVLGL